MRTKNLFITIILGLVVISAPSCSKMDVNDQFDKGDGGDPGRPKSFYQSPINVTINGAASIEATLAPNIGIISVTINNSAGEAVYNKYIDTSVETRLNINISAIPADSYTVYFADQDDAIITGSNFIID